MWLARDKSGRLFAYSRRPIRKKDGGCFAPCKADDRMMSYYEINNDDAPRITFENSPVKVELNITYGDKSLSEIISDLHVLYGVPRQE